MFQSQGAITEKLRSFSMHDLTTIQGDEPVGQRPYQTLPETKKKTRASANESAGKYLSKIKELSFIRKKQYIADKNWKEQLFIYLIQKLKEL